jgi:rare lipoprotein A
MTVGLLATPVEAASRHSEMMRSEKSIFSRVEKKPEVRTRYGAKLRSKRIVSRSTHKGVAVTSRYSDGARRIARADRHHRRFARAERHRTRVARADRHHARRFANASHRRPARVAKVTRIRKEIRVASRSKAQMLGIASYYKMGKRTANGEHFNPMGMTAAHRTLPFGTRVRVTNARSGRSVVVRINDRGPFVHGRIIDLAMGAAQRIGLTGTAKVALQIVN